MMNVFSLFHMTCLVTLAVTVSDCFIMVSYPSLHIVLLISVILCH